MEEKKVCTPQSGTYPANAPRRSVSGQHYFQVQSLYRRRGKGHAEKGDGLKRQPRKSGFLPGCGTEAAARHGIDATVLMFPLAGSRCARICGRVFEERPCRSGGRGSPNSSARRAEGCNRTLFPYSIPTSDRAPTLRAMVMSIAQLKSQNIRHIDNRPCAKPYKYGAPGRNRTCDLALRRHSLYPLSYRGRKTRPEGGQPASLGWWRRRGSNPRPSHCERDALPTELLPRKGEEY